jgi:5'-3' exonuclease
MRSARGIAPVDAIIIDCFYVSYRGFCATRRPNDTQILRSSNGTPTNAIHGLLGAVRRMIKELQPKSVIVATESKTNLRDQMREDYKAGRELPALFSQQIPPIYKICKLCGWHLSLDMIKTATSLGHSPAPPAPDAQPALAL